MRVHAMDITDDVTGLGAGMGGGLIAWLRTPNGWRGLGLAVLSGGAAGFGVYAWLQWTYPSMPGNLMIFFAVVGGILSGLGLELLFTLAVGFRARVLALAERKADSMGLPRPEQMVVSVSVPMDVAPHAPHAAGSVGVERAVGPAVGGRVGVPLFDALQHGERVLPDTHAPAGGGAAASGEPGK